MYVNSDKGPPLYITRLAGQPNVTNGSIEHRCVPVRQIALSRPAALCMSQILRAFGTRWEQQNREKNCAGVGKSL